MSLNVFYGCISELENELLTELRRFGDDIDGTLFAPVSTFINP